MEWLEDRFWASRLAGADLASALKAESFPASTVVVRCNGAQNIGPGERVLHVLEASTPAQRRLGLMFRYRSEMQHDGMLFRYPSDVTAAFTMDNTWMPLRIYWFNNEGACVGFADLEAMSSKQVTSPRPFRYALEVPADRSACLGGSPRLLL